jgi:signal transduction histidine kinase
MSTAVARTAGFAAAGLGGTAIVVGAPHVRFLYQLPTAEAAVDTAVTLAGTFVAVVCVRRFQREQRWGDLLVAAAMLLVAMAEPLFGGVASLLAPYEGARLAPRLVRLLAAVALAVASARPPGDPANGRRRLGPGVPATMAVTVAAVICVLMWRGTALSLAPGTSEAPRILADPAVSAVSLAAAGMFVIATLGFTARGRPAIDPFLGWLASGCALSAVASLDYALYPATSLSLLHVGDFLRLAAAGAWMVGAALEIKSHWDAQAVRARVDERRALARDLHDGLAQDLAFIASQSSSSRSGVDPAWRAELAAAARRALVESRRVVSTLAAAPPENASADVAQTAATAALRHGVGLSLDVDYRRSFSLSERDALVQIVREAVGNAARHGGAGRIHVELAPGRLVRITDDGVGFDPEVDGTPGSFGLVSMRERAEAIGASFDVRSSSQGTVIEVSWREAATRRPSPWRSLPATVVQPG